METKQKPVGLFLTDTHLGKNTIKENLSIFKQAIDKTKELGLDSVYHLGDIFTNREGQSLNTLLTFFEILSLFKKEGVKLIGIPGNHDKVSLNSDSSYLDIFKSDTFEVISSFKSIIVGDLQLIFVPYYKESDYYPEVLKEAKKIIKNKKSILLTHIAVTGVSNNDGSLVENNLKPSDFKVFYKVFTGHYHDKSKVGDNIYYIGSGFPQNFGEDNEKGFTVLFEDGSHEQVKAKFKEYFKTKISIEDIQKNPELITNQYKDLISGGDYVKLIITGDDTKLKSFNQKDLNELGFQVQLKGDKVEQHILEAEQHQSLSFDLPIVVDKYKEFCSEKNFKNKKGLEYLNKL